MVAGRGWAVVLSLALVAGCTSPAGPAHGDRPAADTAAVVAPRAVVVVNGQVAIGTPVRAGAAPTPSPRPTEPSSRGADAPPSPAGVPSRAGQSAAARTLSQASTGGAPRSTRGTLALPDPTDTPGPTAVVPTTSQADAAATASPTPSPVPTLRPAYPPDRYPRLTTHGDRIIVRDRPADPTGFYRSDSLTPGPAATPRASGASPATGAAAATP